MSMHRVLRNVAVAGGVAGLLAVAPLQAQAEPTRFGYQNWPGVTVKTEVAAQLLRAMGYEVETRALDPQFVYQGMSSGDLDLTLGAWMPAHQDMAAGVLEGGGVKHAINIDGAVQGLAIPGYVHDATGLETIEDLVEHGDRFDHTIYGIEAGAGMTRNFQNAVADDYKGLGDWEVQPSSTAGMLSQVKRAARNEEPIVFHGWRPHWMDLEFNLQFLSDDNSTLEQGNEIASQQSTVYTIAMQSWVDNNPQQARFAKQFNVPLDAQSIWIDELTRQDREPEDIARDWIADNMDVVAAWVDGVETADGSAALEAVEASYSQ